MRSLIDRALQYARQPKIIRLLKYGSVSVISTTITNVLLFLFFYVFAIASALWCNALATGITTVPAYYLNRNWTWGKRGKSHLWKEVVPFWVIAALSLVLSSLAAAFVAHNATHVTTSRLGKALLVNLANIFTYGCIWIGRFTLYNKVLFKHEPVHEHAHAGVAEALADEFATEHEQQAQIGQVGGVGQQLAAEASPAR